MQPTLAYFDTNVFDNLLKRTEGVTEIDERPLRTAIDERRDSLSWRTF